MYLRDAWSHAMTHTHTQQARAAALIQWPLEDQHDVVGPLGRVRDERVDHLFATIHTAGSTMSTAK